MKKYLLLCCLPLLWLSCRKSPVSTPSIGKGAVLAMFRVNYLSGNFEGGKTYNYPSYYGSLNQIPVTAFNKPGGPDTTLFGVIYNPANDTVFYGSVPGTGSGTVWYPQMEDGIAAYNDDSREAVSAPAYASIQQIRPGGTTFPAFSVIKLWESVSRLSLTRSMMAYPNARVGLFLYTPDKSREETWRWYWVLFKDKD